MNDKKREQLELTLEAVNELCAKIKPKDSVWCRGGRGAYHLLQCRLARLARSGSIGEALYTSAWEALSQLGWVLSGRKHKTAWPKQARLAYRRALTGIKRLAN